MKKIILPFIIVLITSSLNAQKLDAKQSYLLISDLLKTYKVRKDSSSIKTALKLAYETKNDSLIRETNITYGLVSYHINDLKNLKKSSDNLLENFLNNKDSLSLAKHFHYKALFYRKKFITDSCFYYYHKSKNISILLNDSLSVGRRLLSISRIQQKERDYLGSEITTIEALKFLEPIKADKYISFCYNNMGLVLSNTGRNVEARVYYDKFFKLGYEKSKVKRIRSYIDYKNNTAVSYLRDKNYKKTIEILSNLLKLDSFKIKEPLRYYNALNNVAFCKFKLGNPEKALEDYFISFKYAKKTNNIRKLSESNSMIAEIYLAQNNFSKAKKHALEGLKFGIQSNTSERILQNYRYLARIEKGEKGKEYLKKYITLNDSLYENQRDLKDQFAKIRYETNKKEKENTVLKNENNIKQAQLESEKLQKTIGIISTLSALLLLLLSGLYFKNRRKRLLYQSQLEKAEAREKERQQIAKSLHDEVAGDLRLLHQKLEKNEQFAVAKSLDSVKENVRNLSHQLSSVSFEEVSFKDQIINLISDYFSPSFRISVEGINDCNWKEINSSIKRTLYLSIRESIQNTLKYAEASKTKINFESVKNNIHLSIQDNGKGFDTKSTKNGIGLKNLNERVLELNGTVVINSSLENGTQIKITLPLHV